MKGFLPVLKDFYPKLLVLEFLSQNRWKSMLEVFDLVNIPLFTFVLFVLSLQQINLPISCWLNALFERRRRRGKPPGELFFKDFHTKQCVNNRMCRYGVALFIPLVIQTKMLFLSSGDVRYNHYQVENGHFLM